MYLLREIKMTVEKLPSLKFAPIRTRIRHPQTFDSKNYPYRSVYLDNGITAIVGVQKSQNNFKVQSLLFNTNPNKNTKTWALRKAKDWVKLNKATVKSKVFFEDVNKYAIKKSAPKIMTREELARAVDQLRAKFNQFPKLQKES